MVFLTLGYKQKGCKFNEIQSPRMQECKTICDTYFLSMRISHGQVEQMKRAVPGGQHLRGHDGRLCHAATHRCFLCSLFLLAFSSCLHRIITFPALPVLEFHFPGRQCWIAPPTSTTWFFVHTLFYSAGRFWCVWRLKHLANMQEEENWRFCWPTSHHKNPQ